MGHVVLQDVPVVPAVPGLLGGSVVSGDVFHHLRPFREVPNVPSEAPNQPLNHVSVDEACRLCVFQPQIRESSWESCERI